MFLGASRIKYKELVRDITGRKKKRKEKTNWLRKIRCLQGKNIHRKIKKKKLYTRDLHLEARQSDSQKRCKALQLVERTSPHHPLPWDVQGGFRGYYIQVGPGADERRMKR
jgi:hypothetical protein